jgi:hypothetical protein
MAKLTDEKMMEAFKPHLLPGEEVRKVAFGVKQPNILLIILLICLAILPGIIAVFLLTKNYVIGLTNRRFLVLRVASMSNAAVKAVIEYDLAALPGMKVETSTGGIFTHIKIADAAKPFVAKFHRAYSKTNRESAMAIAAAISPAK